MLNLNILSIFPYYVMIFYNANIISLTDITISIIYVVKTKLMKQVQNLDRISIMQGKQYYANYVSLRNVVTYLKKYNSAISASSLLQLNAELLYCCDPF